MGLRDITACIIFDITNDYDKRREIFDSKIKGKYPHTIWMDSVYDVFAGRYPVIIAVESMDFRPIYTNGFRVLTTDEMLKQVIKPRIQEELLIPS